MQTLFKSWCALLSALVHLTKEKYRKKSICQIYDFSSESEGEQPKTSTVTGKEMI